MSINSNSSKEESEEERCERERLEYNQYVLSDGIHQKIHAMIEKKFQIKLWDKILTRTRQRIRDRGGLISHDDAMRITIAQDGRKILEEIYNEALDEDEYLKKHNPLLLENLRLDKPPEVREQAMRIYHDMMKKFE